MTSLPGLAANEIVQASVQSWIDSLDDIHEYAELLKATVRNYESRGERSPAEEAQAPIDG